MLAGGGRGERGDEPDRDDGLGQCPVLERRAAVIEQRVLVRRRPRGTHRAFGARAVVEREGDRDLARGEPLRAQRAAQRGERAFEHEQQRLGGGDAPAEVAFGGRERIVAGRARAARVVAAREAVGGEPARAEARLDFVGVERGEPADGREAEGA